MYVRAWKTSVTLDLNKRTKSEEECCTSQCQATTQHTLRSPGTGACILATQPNTEIEVLDATRRPSPHILIQSSLHLTRRSYTLARLLLPSAHSHLILAFATSAIPAPRIFPHLSTTNIPSASRIISTRDRFPDVMFRGQDRGSAALPPVSAHPHRRCRSISSRLIRWITIRRWWEQSLAWLCLWCQLQSSPRSSVGLSLSAPAG